jgi:glycine cleavage system transcriptional repressor
MPSFAVTAVGPDCPGVVAAIAGVLVEQGCNLEDTQMAVLRGHAAMMLVVAAPNTTSGEQLHAALVNGTDHLGLAIHVEAISDVPPREETGAQWSVSVHGADRPGLVFEVTRLLAQSGIHITELRTRLPDRIYTMAMEVIVPPETDGNYVADQLDKLAGQLGAACSMRPKPRQDVRHAES